MCNLQIRDYSMLKFRDWRKFMKIVQEEELLFA